MWIYVTPDVEITKQDAGDCASLHYRLGRICPYCTRYLPGISDLAHLDAGVL